MFDDLLELLHTAPAPPMIVDPYTAMATGRRSHVRRRVVLGAAAAGVLAVAVGGFAAATRSTRDEVPSGPTATRGPGLEEPLNAPDQGFLVLAWGGRKHGFQVVVGAGDDAYGTVEFADLTDPRDPLMYIQAGRIPVPEGHNVGGYLVDARAGSGLIYLVTPVPITRIEVEGRGTARLDGPETVSAQVPTTTVWGTVIHIDGLRSAADVGSVTWFADGGRQERAIPSGIPAQQGPTSPTS